MGTLIYGSKISALCLFAECRNLTQWLQLIDASEWRFCHRFLIFETMTNLWQENQEKMKANLFALSSLIVLCKLENGVKKESVQFGNTSWKNEQFFTPRLCKKSALQIKSQLQTEVCTQGSIIDFSKILSLISWPVYYHKLETQAIFHS